jgi:hypothetical protein
MIDAVVAIFIVFYMIQSISNAWKEATKSKRSSTPKVALLLLIGEYILGSTELCALKSP